MRRMVESDPGYLEVLSEKECQRLLGERSVGRIAFALEGGPEIFPVNYVADESVIVFRTGEDTPLQQSALRKVAFEVDDWDTSTGVAWSVIVKGVAQEITGGLDRYSVALRSKPVVPLAPGKRERWLAIYPSDISGRRFRAE